MMVVPADIVTYTRVPFRGGTCPARPCNYDFSEGLHALTIHSITTQEEPQCCADCTDRHCIRRPGFPLHCATSNPSDDSTLRWGENF